MEKSKKKFPKVIVSFKEVGETPLQVIETVKREVPELERIPITYAGRLDPMAEGVLLLLVGEEVTEKEAYLKLDKEYTFEVLFGFATDSYDILGKVTDTEDGVLTEKLLKTAVQGLIGTQSQAYPPYSSKTVKGKPLFEWARESRLHEIKFPVHQVTVHTFDFQGLETITASELKKEITKNIKKVSGDFRQEECLELWRAYIKTSKLPEFQIATFKVRCSSGTYIRSLVHDLSKRLGIPATTYHIQRTSVGEYTVESN